MDAQFHQFPMCSDEGVHFINLPNTKAPLVAYRVSMTKYTKWYNGWGFVLLETDRLLKYQNYENYDS